MTSTVRPVVKGLFIISSKRVRARRFLVRRQARSQLCHVRGFLLFAIILVLVLFVSCVVALW